MDDARAAVAAVLSRIELRHWPWEVLIQPAQSGEEIIRVVQRVPDRDSGEVVVLGSMACGAPTSLKERDVVVWVYAQLRRHVLHELAEAFHLDGRRICNPHADDVEIA